MQISLNCRLLFLFVCAGITGWVYTGIWHRRSLFTRRVCFILRCQNLTFCSDRTRFNHSSLKAVTLEWFRGLCVSMTLRAMPEGAWAPGRFSHSGLVLGQGPDQRQHWSYMFHVGMVGRQATIPLCQCYMLCVSLYCNFKHVFFMVLYITLQEMCLIKMQFNCCCLSLNICQPQG